MEKRTLLAAQTAAGDSNSFSVEGARGVSVFALGLAGAETATLEVTLDGGNNFTAATDANGAIALTADQNSMLVVGPADYRIAKSATAAAVAIIAAG